MRVMIKPGATSFFYHPKSTIYHSFRLLLGKIPGEFLTSMFWKFSNRIIIVWKLNCAAAQEVTDHRTKCQSLKADPKWPRPMIALVSFNLRFCFANQARSPISFQSWNLYKLQNHAFERRQRKIHAMSRILKIEK